MGGANKVQMLPAPAALPRVETGAVQFGSDWPGLFIRGDNAFHLLQVIKGLEERLADHLNENVADLLQQLSQYAKIIESEVIVGSGTQSKLVMNKPTILKVVIEKHEKGYVAYPIGMNGVVVGQGQTFADALTNVRSAIRFHINSFGPNSINREDTPLEVFIAEAEVS